MEFWNYVVALHAQLSVWPLLSTQCNDFTKIPLPSQENIARVSLALTSDN